MLKLINKKFFEIEGKFVSRPAVYLFDISQDGNELEGVFAEVSTEIDTDFAQIQTLPDYDEDIVWRSIENESTENLVSLEGSSINYEILIPRFYNWRHFYFPYQYLQIQKKGSEVKLIFHFSLSYDDAAGWTYKFTLNHVLNQLNQIKTSDNLRINTFTEDASFKSTSFSIEKFYAHNITIKEAYRIINLEIQAIEENLISVLEDFKWKEDYQTNEKMFTLEIMIPLLRKMKFESVRYIHGPDEYGRDITFSEKNKFNKVIYYGLQAKAGDIGGGTNSLIDTIISQIKTAFKMPFKEIGDRDDKMIHFFIVATSGNFTKQARDKILHTIPDTHKNHIFFWDRQTILDLIEIHWKT